MDKLEWTHFDLDLLRRVEDDGELLRLLESPLDRDLRLRHVVIENGSNQSK